jgi:hypothetical protein
MRLIHLIICDSHETCLDCWVHGVHYSIVILERRSSSNLHPSRNSGGPRRGPAPAAPGLSARAESDGSADVEREFLAEISRRLSGEVLRYSERRRLLRRAEGLGIGRFQANLLIATAQHRAGTTTLDPRRPAPGRLPWSVVIGVALIAEAVLLLGLRAVW